MAGMLRDESTFELYNALQESRKQTRRQVTTRCKSVGDLYENATPADIFRIYSEEETLRSLKGKLDNFNLEMEKLLAAPSNEEMSKVRDNWTDRCMEYELSLNEALGKIKYLLELLSPRQAVESSFSVGPDDVATSETLNQEPIPQLAQGPVTEGGEPCPKVENNLAVNSVPCPDSEVKPKEESEASPSDGTSEAKPENEEKVIRPVIVKQEEKLPKFGGDTKKFREWFEQYELVVAGRSPLDKFRKLKTSLSGDALKSISHISLTKEGYETALAIVKEEFGCVFTAQYAHVVDIMKTCGGKMFKNPDKWYVLIPSVSQNVKALKAAAENFNDSAVILLPLILENLPISVKEAFLRGHDYCATDKPIEQLEKFLKFSVREKKIKLTGTTASEKTNADGEKYQASARVQKGSYQFSKAKENSSFLAAQASENDQACLFCEKTNHDSARCKKNVSSEERLDMVQKAGACVKCLNRNHKASKCRTKAVCKSCQGGHHVLLCLKKKNSSQSSSALLGAADVLMEASTPMALPGTGEKTAPEAFLPTGYARVSVGRRSKIRRILLDPGSQKSYITFELARALGARADGRELLVTHTLGGNSSDVQEFRRYRIALGSRFDPSVSTDIVCLGIETITKTIFPPAQTIRGVSEYADHVELAESEKIDILIGSCDLGCLWLNDCVMDGDMLGWKTSLGWFTLGRKAPFGKSATACLCAFESRREGPDDSDDSDSMALCGEPMQPSEVRDDIEILFRSEVLGIEAPTEDDSLTRQKFEEIFSGCIRRLPCGRYSLKLPFNEKLHSLGDNERLARTRLASLLKNSSPEVLGAVDAEIAKYVESGYAEEAPPRRRGEFAHYLALQVVKKPSADSPSGFKIRIVKDAGARSKNLASLNDVLHTGPNMLPNILNVLTRFRNQPIVVVADIEKAFHQFQIDRCHRTFLRFFWRPNFSNNKDAPIKEFWAKCLDFGLVSSPWLHQAGVKHHLDNEKSRRPLSCDLIEEIQYSIYMDDISFGALNTGEASFKTKDCIEIFEQGHFPLKKWACNSRRLAESLEETFPDAEIKVKFDEEDFKFLGVRWNQRTDKLGAFAAKAVSDLRSGTPTKRTLLSGLARVFDPLGFLSPVLIQAKPLLQKLWKENVSWDEELTGQNREAFLSFANQLEIADGFCVRRSPSDVNEIPIRTELHAFSDASKDAFGAVLYTRDFYYAYRKPRVTFLISKAKVTPNKGIWTIHRLELMAALIAVRLVSKLKDALGRPVDATHFWCDNSAVLGWVKEEPSKWKTFVANRISEIQVSTRPEDWCYVSTKDNPADLLSRGSSLSEVCEREFFRPLLPNANSEFWLRGPKWLSEAGLPRPKTIGKTSFAEAIVEAKKDSANFMIEASSGASRCLLDAAHFSSWSKAVKTVVIVLKFIDICRRRNETCGGKFTTAADYAAASRVLMRNLQSVSFPKEVESRCAKLTKGSKLALLNPFVDEDGLIRCRSRLENSAELSFEEKFPIILDGGNAMVRLLLGWIHASKTLHAQGISTNLHHVRSEFLILKARSSMNKVLRGCMVCAKFRAKPASEVVPPLPAFRMDACVPFAITGIDFAGPIWVKDGNGDKSKSWIILFVCAASRAVHLDLTPDMTTHEFLLSLRKFVCRFPSVSKIMSDNGSTFRRSDKEMKLFYSNLRRRETQAEIWGSQIVWEFITEGAPTQGAWWERIVQLVKRPLRKAIGTTVPEFRELESILAEIELCINLRPITAPPSQMCEVRALCPADLVFGFHARSRFPNSSLISRLKIREQAILLSKAWRRQQAVLNSFWKRFHADYLQQLRSAHERESKSSNNLKVGDVCLLADRSPSRSFWPLCRIVNLFGGERTDLRRRSCMIKLGSGKVVKRPISSLYPLGLPDE